MFLLISLFSLCTSAPLNLYPQSASQTTVCESFSSVKKEIENRWNTFQEGKKFQVFRPGRSDQELQEEFETIHQTRQSLCEKTEYEVAQHLIASNLVRAPGYAAFDFNNTVPYYNASTIYLGGKYYIACEGPKSKDISSFFQLLKTHHVTHLVRLTGSYEGWIKKCHPYWEDLTSQSSDGKTYLNIPNDNSVYPIQAFHLDHWQDNQGINPEELLQLALQVREGLNREKGLLVVHCSAGVGRTGTFLASLAILDAIDQGGPFSIEEIVYRLSLQRRHSVGKAGQYVTLHRLAESYLRLKDCTFN